MEVKDVHQSVQEYYGKELNSSFDLQTNACCTVSSQPDYIRKAEKNVHHEVVSKYYGCGLTIPLEIEGLKILDLGSGSGRDCYIASQLVGENGFVVGVDMTDEQLDVANRHIDYHTEKFGYQKPNVRFVKGNIENLDELDLEEGSFDLIISNCVINLAVNKSKVLSDVYRLLKLGGEMYFSDVYSDRRIPADLQKDQVLWGECLSGALYWNDFQNLAKKAGFTDPRAVKNDKITIENKALEEKVGDIEFFSVTYRLWKINSLESHCEDYGEAVRYNGTIAAASHSFTLDDHHVFPKGKILPVCGNTYDMLHKTRFSKHFEFYGNREIHYGIFEGCGTEIPFNQTKDVEESGASCC